MSGVVNIIFSNIITVSSNDNLSMSLISKTETRAWHGDICKVLGGKLASDTEILKNSSYETQALFWTQTKDISSGLIDPRTGKTLPRMKT